MRAAFASTARLQRAFGLALLVLAVVAAPASAGSLHRPEWRDLARAIDADFAAFGEPGHPGLGVTLIHGGEVIFQGLYGQADPSTGAPFTAATPVQAASVTKSLVATAVLELERDGRLKLDDPVRRHLPELSAAADAVTVRHLLMMSAGLWQDEDSIELAGGLAIGGEASGYTARVSADEMFAFVQRQREPIFVPGTAHLYADTNSRLLVRLATRVTGLTFDGLMRRYVYERYGMADARTASHYSDLRPGEAGAYFGADPGSGLSRRIVPWESFGDSGTLLSLNDLTNWLLTVLDEGAGRAATLRRMAGPYTYPNGLLAPYGLGIYLGYEPELDLVSWCHAGANGSLYCYVPEYDLGYVSVSNWRGREADSFAKVMRRFVAAAAARKIARDRRHPLALDRFRREGRLTAQEGRRLAGRYIAPGRALAVEIAPNADGAELRLLDTVTALRRRAPRQYASMTLADNPRFLLREPPSPGGALQLVLGGERFELTRADGASRLADDTAGIYASDVLGATYRVRTGGAGPMLLIGAAVGSSHRRPLIAIGPDYARTPDGALVVEFVRDSASRRVNGMRVRSAVYGSIFFARLSSGAGAGR